ncbi:MAG TPA: hypothetical protein PLQ76_09670 [bacterium]|nr:hypothetical protein [bacterium]
MTRLGKIIILALFAAVVLSYFFVKPARKAPAPTVNAPAAAAGVREPSSPAEAPAQDIPAPQPVQVQPQPQLTPEEIEAAAALNNNAPPPADGSFAPVPMTASVSSNDFSLLEDRYGRPDPFAPLYPPPAKPAIVEDFFPAPPKLVRPLLPSVLENPPSFSLTAISIKGNSVLAVINGELARVGDSILGFTIRSITSDKVEMKSAEGDKVILRIKQDTHGLFDVRGSNISNMNQAQPSPAGLLRGNASDVEFSPVPGKLPPPVTDFNIDDLQRMDPTGKLSPNSKR